MQLVWTALLVAMLCGCASPKRGCYATGSPRQESKGIKGHKKNGNYQGLKKARDLCAAFSSLPKPISNRP